MTAPSSAPPSGNRVIILGIDGAEPEIVERFISEGSLPAFARLRDSAVFTRLRSTPMPVSPQAWATFATGLNPGRHGVFSFMDRIPGTLSFRQSNATHVAAPTFWHLAGEAGLRCAVLNVPLTFPASPVNGLLVAGWLTPTPRSRGFTYPPQLADRLARHFGPYPLHAPIRDLATRGLRERALQAALTSMWRKADIAWYLWQQAPWDLFIFTLVEIDTVQHFLWPSSDDDDLDALRRAYLAADHILARWLDACDDDCTILVVSDHGAGLNSRGAVYLPGLLEQLGYTVRRPRMLPALAQGAYHLADRLLPTALKRRLAARAPALRSAGMAAGTLQTIDWSRTRAYSYWDAGRADVWINLAGRDPAGIVQPDEYDPLVADLCDLLMTCTDPATGLPAVESAVPKGRLYHGPYLDAAPDIVVTFRHDSVLDGLKCGDVVVTRPSHRDIHVAQHRPYGILLAGGRGIRPGVLPQAPALADLAPTVLHLLGLPVPTGLDGRVLSEILAPASHRETTTPYPAAASITSRPRTAAA